MKTKCLCCEEGRRKSFNIKNFKKRRQNMFSLKTGSKNTRIVVFSKHLSIQTTHKIFTRDFPPPTLNSSSFLTTTAPRVVYLSDGKSMSRGLLQSSRKKWRSINHQICIIQSDYCHLFICFSKKKVTMIHLWQENSLKTFFKVGNLSGMFPFDTHVT